tara:strand:- start:44 stop:223 length:180 start_codon:yes stop_codon:yes gene_type:complete
MARKKKEQLYQVEKRWNDLPDSEWSRQKGRLTQEQAEEFITERTSRGVSESLFRITKDK